VSFPTFADFLAMGGHGLYVWTSYALGVAAIVASVVGPARARRRFFVVEGERQKRDLAGQRSSDASRSS
jgi:heme exporter protein D